MKEQTTETQMKTDTTQDMFGPVVYAYTRAQALADGEQVEIDRKTSKEAGFRYPVFITRGAYYKTIAAGGRWEPDGNEETLVLPGGQDVRRRTWDILMMLCVAIRRAGGHAIRFSVLVDEKGNGHPRPVELVSDCGPLDVDNPEPAITIMLPEDQ